MKNSIFINGFIWCVIGAFMWACQSTSIKEDAGVQRLKNQRDSLISVQGTVENKIDAIDKKLSRLDTSRRLYKVTVYPTKIDSFKHFFEVYGSASSDKSITLFPESMGTINSLQVKEGQTVRQGQLLASLDTKVIEKSIAQLHSEYETAKTIYEKRKNLWSQNIGSEVEYLNAKNRKNSLEAQLARLNEQKNQAQVRAPFAGVIDKIFPKEGEMANPSSPIMRLVNLGEVYIEADVAETYLSKISSGAPVRVDLSTLDTSVQSTIVQTGQYIDPNNRTFKIRVDLPPAIDKVKPNMMTMLHVQDYSTDSAIVLPNRMVLQNPEGKDFVYVLEPDEGGKTGVVGKQTVRTGKTYNNQIEIKGGLKAGEMVVDRGARSIKEGQIVEVVQEKSSKQYGGEQPK